MGKAKLANYDDGKLQTEFENVYNEFTLFSPPSFTSAERDALEGDSPRIIFNSEASKHQAYDGTSWNDLY